MCGLGVQFGGNFICAFYKDVYVEHNVWIVDVEFAHGFDGGEKGQRTSDFNVVGSGFDFFLWLYVSLFLFYFCVFSISALYVVFAGTKKLEKDDLVCQCNGRESFVDGDVFPGSI